MNEWQERFYCLVFDLFHQYGMDREELTANYDGIDEGYLEFEKSINGDEPEND